MRRRKKKNGTSGESLVEPSGDPPPDLLVEPSGSSEREPDPGVAPQDPGAGSDQDPSREAHRPGQRGRAAAPPEIPRPGVAWGNVIRDTFEIPDPAGLARRLREELILGDENRTSYAAVLEALDKSARNLDDAGRLFRAAKVEEERFRLETEVNLEILRTDASKILQAEYREKIRKSPTIQDVEDKILDRWPTEYTEILERRAELHGAVRSLEILVKAWGSRAADLRIMAERTARAGTGR